MDILGVLLGTGILFFCIPGVLGLLLAKKSVKVVPFLCLSLMITGSLLLLFFSGSVLWSGEVSHSSITMVWFEIPLFIDRLAAFFILCITIISIGVLIYSFGYLKHIPSALKRNFLVALMSFFILSMIFVVASEQMLSFLFFWEIMALASFFLVMFNYEEDDTKKAGLFYLVMTQLSTLFLLAAFLMIYNETGSLTITAWTGFTNPTILFLFLLLGFGTKAGVIPFHKWLPYAHPASPSPVSALMSGIMIKVALYGLLRFILLLPSQPLWWGLVILVLGTISALLGVIYALKEHDIKCLLAYHSIENIGIILIGIGLYLVFLFYGFEELAWVSFAAALFHTLNHALFKSLLFMSAGSVVTATQTKNIDKMGGLIKRMPFTAVFFLIGAVSIAGLPPFNGFVSEFMLFSVFFQSNVIASPIIKVILFLCLSLFAMTSTLAVACFVKVFGTVFLAHPRSSEAAEAKEASFSMAIGQAVLAFFCIVLGVFSFQIFGIVAQKTGVAIVLPDLLGFSIILGVLVIALFLAVRFLNPKNVRISETWGCGISSQNATMEYTASGFSEPIITIFSSIYRTKKTNQRTFHDEFGAVFKEGYAEITLLKFFEKYLYMPIVRVIQSISSVLYNLQNEVELDRDILFGFLTIVILLVIVGVAV
ncbi:hydrogenase membrane subunit [Candidatus Woesearchaeota archaeon]|nr:hydrogenase membrane subunit [Candidatus Woesearchaeota archaeon]